MNELVVKRQDGIDGIHSDISKDNQYLTFNIADETYGVEILKVQEIRGWSEPTQLPNAPEFIRGVMNLRGAIVPILDLRSRFNMDDTQFTQHTVIIVVNVQERTIGMVVDAVSDVIDLEEGSIKESPDFGTSIDASFIRGLSEVDDNMIILLNIDTMLESCELVQLDQLSTDNESAN